MAYTIQSRRARSVVANIIAKKLILLVVLALIKGSITLAATKQRYKSIVIRKRKFRFSFDHKYR